MCFECVSKYTKKGVFVVNNLKCRKLGFNKLICKRTNKTINISDCANCPYKEYKDHFPNNRKPIKQRSNKLANLERNRTSLFTDDLDHCIICGKSPVNVHEIFGGRNRLNSIKYKLVIPLCTKEHHNQIECKGIHFDKHLRNEWHIKGQIMFNKAYPDLNFRDIFGKNYKKN